MRVSWKHNDRERWDAISIITFLFEMLETGPLVITIKRGDYMGLGTFD